VNCASIPPSLIASELFGHERGFHRRFATAPGRFELAHSGTIFLDEIGELPAETQVALLRVLQERQFERVEVPRHPTMFESSPLPTAIYLQRSLRSLRTDLFLQVNVFPIRVPPLRNGKGHSDVGRVLRQALCGEGWKANQQDRQKYPKAMQSYHWREISASCKISSSDP